MSDKDTRDRLDALIKAEGIPVGVEPVARFCWFDEGERDCLHFAVTQAARRILDDAGDDRIAKELLPSAAVTFATLSRLSRDLDIASGMTPPDAESIDIVASTIAAGLAPEAKAAAECDVNECSQECEEDGCQGRPS